MNPFTLFCGDPGGTQTHDLQNRNLTLYSTKLPGQMRGKCKHNLLVSQPLSGFIFVLVLFALRFNHYLCRTNKHKAIGI